MASNIKHKTQTRASERRRRRGEGAAGEEMESEEWGRRLWQEFGRPATLRRSGGRDADGMEWERDGKGMGKGWDGMGKEWDGKKGKSERRRIAKVDGGEETGKKLRRRGAALAGQCF